MKRDRFTKASTSLPKPPPMPAIEHYRGLSNLEHLIASRPETFWCYPHLAEMPLSERSVDPRYCKACNAVLTRDREDSRALGNFKRPWWVPQNSKRRGKDGVVEIQGPQTMSAQKDLIPIISVNNASILNKTQAKDTKNGIIHHLPREILRNDCHLPIKRNKQLAFEDIRLKEAVKV